MPSSFHKCVVFVTIHGLLNYFCSVSQLCSTHCDSFWVASNFLFLQTLLAGTFLTTDVCLWVFSYVQLFVALWTVAHRDPLSMGFPWQEYLSGLHFLLLLLLSHFSRVRLCVTPETAAHQAPPSLGFSRQEPWSGLPFPSPMQESEKWKWSCSVASDS